MDDSAVLYRNFFEAVDSIQKDGFARPGQRALGYVFKSDDDMRSKLDPFVQYVKNAYGDAAAACPGDRDPEYSAQLPRTAIARYASPPSALVLVSGDEAYGAALTRIGRPAIQTTIQPG